MQNEEFFSKLSEILDKKFSLEELTLANILSDVSATISKKRIELGMTQKEFARFMGVTQSMVSKWEKGDYNFTLESLVNIACKLDMNIANPIIEKVNNIKLFETSYQTATTRVYNHVPQYSNAKNRKAWLCAIHGGGELRHDA